MRIFALSDIHIDYPTNLQWLQNLSGQDYVEDILILAGDVTDDLDLLASALELLVKKFRKVCFVPGNSFKLMCAFWADPPHGVFMPVLRVDDFW